MTDALAQARKALEDAKEWLEGWASADKQLAQINAARAAIDAAQGGAVQKDAGWLPIKTAPAGRCLMWVADAGERRAGAVLFGTVYVYSDERSYRPDGCHGDWHVTHWMPIPHRPTGA